MDNDTLIRVRALELALSKETSGPVNNATVLATAAEYYKFLAAQPTT